MCQTIVWIEFQGLTNVALGFVAFPLGGQRFSQADVGKGGIGIAFDGRAEASDAGVAISLVAQRIPQVGPDARIARPNCQGRAIPGHMHFPIGCIAKGVVNCRKRCGEFKAVGLPLPGLLQDDQPTLAGDGFNLPDHGDESRGLFPEIRLGESANFDAISHRQGGAHRHAERIRVRSLEKPGNVFRHGHVVGDRQPVIQATDQPPADRGGGDPLDRTCRVGGREVHAPRLEFHGVEAVRGYGIDSEHCIVQPLVTDAIQRADQSQVFAQRRQPGHQVVRAAFLQRWAACFSAVSV